MKSSTFVGKRKIVMERAGRGKERHFQKPPSKSLLFLLYTLWIFISSQSLLLNLSLSLVLNRTSLFGYGSTVIAFKGFNSLAR